MYALDKLIVLLKDLSQKKCERCSLHYEKHHDQCPHCSDLDDIGLKVYFEDRGIDPNAKSGLGQFLFFGAIIVLIIYFLSRFLKM